MLPADDLSWLFKTRSPGGADKQRALGAWKAIASALPQRTASSVWSAGTRLLHPDNYKAREPSHDPGYPVATVACIASSAFRMLSPRTQRLCTA